MPEIIEVEMYRRSAEAAIGREIASLRVSPPAFCRPGTESGGLELASLGGAVEAVTRRGKLLMLVLDSGHWIGVRFGMTGRLVVDGGAVIERLEYGPRTDDPSFVRFSIGFADGGSLEVNDARRLGSVELDPDVAKLGPDAWNVTGAELERVLLGRVAIKTRLLDQARLAGLGNLLTDEVLWRAGIDPRGAAGSAAIDRVSLSAQIREVIAELDGLGGSHRGQLQAERGPDGVCPLDGSALEHSAIGGRSTYWCPVHQR